MPRSTQRLCAGAFEAVPEAARNDRLLDRIGLGLAALGRPGYITLGRDRDFADRDEAAMQARCFDVLDAAWAAGIRRFDTARSYGKAEMFLSAWLAARSVPPDQVWVSSKWGYRYTANWQVTTDLHEVKDLSAGHFRSQWPESEALLGRHLDLYQVHSLTLDSGALDDSVLLADLAALKRRNIAVGFSTSGPGQAETIDRALEIVVDGVRLFDAVQSTWNILERSAGEALLRAKAAGLVVVIKEGVANGRLTDRGLASLPTAMARDLRARCRERAVGLDAVALGTAMHQPFADVVLSGAVTVDQLASNLAAVSVTPAEANEILAVTRAIAPDTYWAERKALPWH